MMETPSVNTTTVIPVDVSNVVDNSKIHEQKVNENDDLMNRNNVQVCLNDAMLFLNYTYTAVKSF